MFGGSVCAGADLLPPAGEGWLSHAAVRDGNARSLGKPLARGNLGYPLRRFSLPLAVPCGSWCNGPMRASAPTTARGARSEAERAERGTGQMRPCNPIFVSARAAESAIKPVLHLAAPVGRSSQTRRHHLTPTPVQQLCTNVQSCDQGVFSLWTVHGPFLFWQDQKRNGGCICPAIPMADIPASNGTHRNIPLRDIPTPDIPFVKGGHLDAKQSNRPDQRRDPAGTGGPAPPPEGPPGLPGGHGLHHPGGHHQRPAATPGSTSAPWTSPRKRTC